MHGKDRGADRAAIQRGARVIMIEGAMPEAVQAALAGPLGSAAFNSFALTDPARGTYVLQFDLLTSAS